MGHQRLALSSLSNRMGFMSLGRLNLAAQRVSRNLLLIVVMIQLCIVKWNWWIKTECYNVLAAFCSKPTPSLKFQEFAYGTPCEISNLKKLYTTISPYFHPQRIVVQRRGNVSLHAASWVHHAKWHWKPLRGQWTRITFEVMVWGKSVLTISHFF